ncbi:Bug family tripartite tricarboxylate transporter substrate binding protein [Candidatus Formimonas warabiya]|uniref:Tripartite tricarboxylate transporter substrate binding protein n=1 Tax=Formimonas warabiya TaxID=1761012 RepID=A0A3G1KUJ9_FORW1|nr:tripartite tricarboxylate transporter substrate-binding protein [Candidatus Formimonas warabiya]ATW25865.1 hypothetical protein DCMF_14780 [Candidatus Formimonas warabiya]
MKKARIILVLILGLCLAFTVACTSEKAAPPAPESDKPPFTEMVMYTDGTPGSIGDLFIRTLGPIIEKQSGVKVVYKNISGGSGTNVMTDMMNDKKHVSVVAHSCSLPLAWATGSSPYTSDQVASVCSISTDYIVVFTRPDSPFNSWQDVVAYAKDHPGELKWGGSGVQGSQQLLHQLFMDELGIDLEYVPYDNAASVRVGVLAGDVDIGSNAFGNILTDIVGGTYKGLVVTSPERFDSAPDLETVGEAGISSAIGNSVWRAFFCPASYDQAVIEYLAKLIENAKNTDEWTKFLQNNNQVRWDLGPE